MALQADSKGFLVGDPVKLDDALDDIPVIRQDIASIRRLLEKSSKVAATIPVAVNRLSREIGRQNQINDKPSSASKSDARESTAITRNEAVTPQGNRKQPAESVAVAVNVDVQQASITAKQPVAAQVANEEPASVPPVASKAIGGSPASKPQAQEPTPNLGKAKPKAEAPIPEEATPIVRQQAVAPAARRGVNGRFLSGDEQDERTGIAGAVGRVGDAIGKMGEKFDGALGDSAEVDPAIAAAQEIKGAITPVVSAVVPLGRGVASIFGKNEEAQKKRWYRRVINNLTWLRRDGTRHHKREFNALKDIEAGQDKKGGSGLLKLAGLIAASLGTVLTGAFKKLGLLSAAKAMGNLTCLGGRGSKGKAAKGRAGPNGAVMPDTGSSSRPGKDKGKSKLGAVAKTGKGLLKKIPILGGLLAAGAVMVNEASDTMTRREKDAANGGSVGMLGGASAGAAIGAAIGTAILPGIGTAIGGAAGAFFGGEAGAIIGEEAGLFWNDLRTEGIGTAVKNRFNSWVATLESSELVQSIQARWGTWISGLESSEVGQYMKKQFGGIAAGMMAGWNVSRLAFEGAWDGVSEWSSKQLGALNDWVKEWSGIDLKQTIPDAITGVTDLAKPVVNAVVKVASPIVNNVAEEVSTTYKNTKERMNTQQEVDNVFTRRSGKSAGSSGSKGKIAKTTKEERQAILLEGAKEAGITDQKELANFMGQTDHETGGFSRMSENLNYKPARLLEMFKGRNGINTMADAKRIVAGGQESIANAVYGGNWGKRKLGNTEEGDGWKFRGRGFKQLTGRDNYTAAGKALGIDLASNPDLAADPKVSAKIAAWYWKKRVPKSARKDVKKATLAINGGDNGLKGRYQKTAKWEKKLKSGDVPVVAKRSAETKPVETPETVKSAKAEVPTDKASKPVAAKTPAVVRTRASMGKTPVVPKTAVAQAMVGPPRPPKIAATPAIADTAGKKQIAGPPKPPPQQSPIPDVGRDVPDRQIMHAITGGMGGTGKNHLLSG